jgi:hypothetical protein
MCLDGVPMLRDRMGKRPSDLQTSIEALFEHVDVLLIVRITVPDTVANRCRSLNLHNNISRD